MATQHLYADDAPGRPGNRPQPGDSQWTLIIPLHNGDTLKLYVGEKGRAAFRTMLFQEEIDDHFDRTFAV